jgi:hypothetical protein
VELIKEGTGDGQSVSFEAIISNADSEFMLPDAEFEPAHMHPIPNQRTASLGG